MTNMSIRTFSARTMQFNIASLLFSSLNFHTGFLFQSITGSSILLFYYGLNFCGELVNPKIIWFTLYMYIFFFLKRIGAIPILLVLIYRYTRDVLFVRINKTFKRQKHAPLPSL